MQSRALTAVVVQQAGQSLPINRDLFGAHEKPSGNRLQLQLERHRLDFLFHACLRHGVSKMTLADCPGGASRQGLGIGDFLATRINTFASQDNPAVRDTAYISIV